MSNCDSDGCPIDHEGCKLEDGVLSGAPFAVRGDVFREIFSGSCKDVSGSHLDARPLEGSWVRPSSLGGGIPVAERVEIEDLGEGYDSDEPLSSRSAAELCKNETSATIQAMMRSTKHEREALVSTRNKLMGVLKFLKSKGFSEESVLEQLHLDGFGSSIPSRTEFGLPDGPPAKGLNPFVDKMKGVKVDEDAAQTLVDVTDEARDKSSDKSRKVFDEKPECKDNGNHEDPKGTKRKSWAEMLKPASNEKPSFDYIPLKAGSTVVSPPKEVLLKGNEKLKHSVVGVFSKGCLPFRKVEEFAAKNWLRFGLQHISQKDAKTFIFRFKDDGGMNSVLSYGTWYLEKRPLIVHAWGSTPGSISHMPLWVRFDNVPDAYWTREGLSCLSSAIGKPLTADELTCKLEILPFAKLCVDYKIGDYLPSKLDVEVLDPNSEVVHIHEVLVSYPIRPTVCTGCKSLGHLVGACPTTVRKWVEKSHPKSDSKHDSSKPEHPVPTDIPTAKTPAVDGEIPAAQPSTDDKSWQPVHKKSAARLPVASPSSESPPHCNTFRNLTMVDEVDAKRGTGVDEHGSKPLSKSQRKKLRRSSRILGPSPTSN